MTSVLNGARWVALNPDQFLDDGINRLKLREAALGNDAMRWAIGFFESTGLAQDDPEIASGKKNNKALIIATHHPPYSSAGHTGSTEMSQSIDAICSAAGVVPGAFLSGHAHNYQRYTRRTGGKQVPYIVAGTGGIAPQKVPDATGQPADDSHETTCDAAMASYGYLYVTASPKELKFEFWPLSDSGHSQPYDPFTVDLNTHILTRG